METIFPTDTGFEGLFFVGWHRSPAGQITRTGTVVLKRTYDIDADADPALGALTPSESPLPVFMLDQPEALVLNPDFESGVGDWTPEGSATVAQGEADGNKFLVVGGTNVRVTQAIDLGSALRGREFVLSLKAKADAATSIAGVRLEAGGQVLCEISGPLTTQFQTLDGSGVWTNSLGATSLTVVLKGAVDAGRQVHYDDITLTHIGYEHDMCADKPAGDVIVLPGADRLPQEVQVNDAALLRRPASDPPALLRVFGWELRAEGLRKMDGAFPEPDSAYPLPRPLPDAFLNLYYNGYRRTPREAVSPLPPGYLPASARVRITRSSGGHYGFQLNGEALAASYFYYSGTGDDVEARWQSRAVAMNLDTLVVEPDDDRGYAVWRGVWEYDERPEDSYRRLVVTVA
jgi:hypothetical protein